MGIYLNPGNSGFSKIRNAEYVDKSGLIDLVNRSLDTPDKLSCVSRPRRFGKSFAAQMLCAYYDKTCDSRALFEDLGIARNDSTRTRYEEHLNSYDVIYLDMASIVGECGIASAVTYVKRAVEADVVAEYPRTVVSDSLVATLASAVEFAGNKFIAVIDEWDAPIREGAGSPQAQKVYLEFLRSLFKNSGVTDKVFAGAYLTGILPIKKDGSQTAVSDFREYTMLDPGGFARYIGFTAADVKGLCERHCADFDMMRFWYDGYALPKVGSVYNPNSVMSALRSESYKSYWALTSAADSLMTYIRLDFQGMAKIAAELLGGVEVEVDTLGFSNDLESFKDCNDILTLLIHLGYLSYDAASGRASIPNEEVRLEFARTLRRDTHEATARRVRESDQLIADTVQGNADAVAAQVQKVHAEEAAALFYNDEQALRGVVKLAYFSYKDHYLKFEELPGGDGFADIVYFPKQGTPLPALVVELKCNGSAGGAIEQIRDKRYPDVLEGYGGEVLLVGIAYDKRTREHSCSIERM